MCNVSVLECGDYPTIINASAPATVEKAIGSTVTFTCDSDYHTSSMETVINITCNFLGGVSRNWTQPNETQCYGKSLLFCSLSPFGCYFYCSREGDISDITLSC